MVKRVSKAKTLMLLALLPTASFATSVEGIVNNAVNYLQGPLARAVGVGGIVVCGYMCFKLQKLPKEHFILIGVGLGLIFGASSLYSTLVG